MIQEKDFLYRVPVKNVLVTTPRQQVRNPEILVDVEGGEFMHGNILDANSTNKLINQSVKDAVDNKLIESGHVTKGLLEAEITRATEQDNSLKILIGAETSARTKGDEDLSSKIKAEQTRAEGKEKEISDKLAIVNGDSNTEGSFRKAIADVVAAAPEDLDTLKEIADKLAGNDDLHTALNQAITEKADASALLNEVTRATGAESGLQAAIATKADAIALGNYVLTTALNKQVDTLNAAISAKQDKPDDGNMFLQVKHDSVTGAYQIDKDLTIKVDDANTASFGPYPCISLKSGDANTMAINYAGMSLKSGGYTFTVDPTQITQVGATYKFDVNSSDGIKWSTTDGAIYSKMDQSGIVSYIHDNCYTKCNNTDFLDIRNASNNYVTLSPESLIMKKGDDQDDQQVLLTPEELLVKNDQTGTKLWYNNNKLVVQDGSRYIELGPFANQASGGLSIHDGSKTLWIYPHELVIQEKSKNSQKSTRFNYDGITSPNGSISFTNHIIIGLDIRLYNSTKGMLSETIEDIYTSKQDKITPTTELDLTSIDTADIESLRSIVKSLATELNTLGLIKLKSAEETA